MVSLPNILTEGQAQLVRDQCVKTVQCKFYPHCLRGTGCPFAHGNQELRGRPNLRKTSICKAWKRGNCPCSARWCMFAHGRWDLRMTEEPNAACLSQRRAAAGSKRSAPEPRREKHRQPNEETSAQPTPSPAPPQAERAGKNGRPEPGSEKRQRPDMEPRMKPKPFAAQPQAESQALCSNGAQTQALAARAPTSFGDHRDISSGATRGYSSAKPPSNSETHREQVDCPVGVEFPTPSTNQRFGRLVSCNSVGMAASTWCTGSSGKGTEEWPRLPAQHDAPHPKGPRPTAAAELQTPCGTAQTQSTAPQSRAQTTARIAATVVPNGTPAVIAPPGVPTGATPYGIGGISGDAPAMSGRVSGGPCTAELPSLGSLGTTSVGAPLGRQAGWPIGGTPHAQAVLPAGLYYMVYVGQVEVRVWEGNL